MKNTAFVYQWVVGGIHIYHRAMHSTTKKKQKYFNLDIIAKDFSRYFFLHPAAEKLPSDCQIENQLHFIFFSRN